MSDKELRELDLWIAEHIYEYSERIEVSKAHSLKTAEKWVTAFKKEPKKSPFHSTDYSHFVTRSGDKIYCGRPFDLFFPPRFSASPDDAMAVLEKCLEIHEPISLYKMVSEEKYCAICYREGDKIIDTVRVIAETLPLAIALFARRLFDKEWK